jgi:uncharacterized protein YciI
MTTELTFIYVLRLVDLESLAKMSPEEAIIDEHFEYLKQYLTVGKLTLADRCLNGEFGIVIFRAESEGQAKDFMKNDPAVNKGTMAAELHRFRVALMERS